MVGRKLFLIAGLLAASCAEIQPLTGGEKDDVAPKVVEQYPEQGALYVGTNYLKLKFDEYFTLVDPANTIQVNPSLGKIKAEQVKKRVIVSWSDSLQPTTTYVIQFNGTVKDLNEGNDTIIQFAFSTGGQLDSLSLKGVASDAFTNGSKKQVTVGLYGKDTDPLKDKPVYAIRTNANGEFKFNYLPDTVFQLYAFNDVNKNQTIDASEEVGFLDRQISTKDTGKIVLQLFQPKIKKQRLQISLNHPGTATVYNKDNLSLDSLRVNDGNVALIERYSSDSALIVLPTSSNDNWRFVYGKDTVFKTRESVSKQTKLKPVTKAKSFFPSDSIQFQFNDLIQSVDTNQLKIKTDTGDSIPYTYFISKNKMILAPKAEKGKSLIVDFKEKALKGLYGTSNDTLKVTLPLLTPTDLCILKLALENFSGQWIVQLAQGNDIIQTKIKKDEEQTMQFDRIVPGNYTIICIHDKNKNGVWDTGEMASKKQAEVVLRFTLKQKMRANWEVEEILQYKP